MGLKNGKGNYLRIGRIEAIDIYSKKSYPRIYQHDTEDARQDHPMEPDKNFCVHEVSLTDEQIKIIQDIHYDALKNHKVKKEINHPAETDEDGEIIKKAWTEEIFDFPYADMIDC